MDSYITIYLLYLYIYSFVGWVYETTFVSTREKKFINRGFMHGPFLPIYGAGALIIIFANKFSHSNGIEFFLISIVFCTFMELCTGLVMESLFKVRYWDYRKIPGNIKGYIAPPVSLFWGILALILNYFVHPFISHCLSYIPFRYLEIATYILTIYTAVDFTLSFVESMDLRRTLENIAQNNKEIKKLRDALTEKRKNISINLISLKDYTHALQIETKNALNLKLAEMHKNNPQRSKHALNVLKRNPNAISTKYVQELKQFLKHDK
jgi:uncharacterized membrane protein